MMRFVPAVLLFSASLSSAAKDHDDNPLFRELTRDGIDIGAKEKALLPAPTMADGLDAAGQKKVLEELVKGSYELDDFTRNSIVAPNVLRIRDIKPFDPKAPARGVDFWFVAYGDWKKVADKDFLQKAWNSTSGGSKSTNLAAADLTKRNIAAPKEKEAYAHSTFSLFSKVEIASTGHAVWSKTDNSFIVAGKVDRRFDKDAQFPNQWRSIGKNDDGKTVYGTAQPFHGAAYYMKMTRLRDPDGAMLIEGHVIFTEPVGWFNGENYLRSKLPVAMLNQVKVLRRESLKTVN
jgi:hypothetical protein